MSFANPLPWWALGLVVAAAALVAWLAYSRRTLPPSRRAVLVALRFITLLALVVFLLRPVASGIDADAHDAVVPILVDTSRSMGIEDAAGGDRRIERARRILVDRLLPALGSQFHVEVLGFGDGVAPVAPDALSATARRSDVEGALAGVRDRYRGRAVAGIILLSDGGDTSGAGERAAEGGPPIYAHRRRLARGRQGPRDPRRHRGRDHPGRLASGSGGVGGESRTGQHADRAAASRERPAHRREARDARGGGVARA